MENTEDQILDESGAPIDLKKLSKGQLKKLKEKEKKKKEEEAAAAAEAEAKKKAEQDSNGAAQPSEAQAAGSEATEEQEGDETENKDGTKKELSKGQLKKLKQKEKEKKTDEPVAKVEEKKEEEDDGGKDDKKKKGGKKVSAVAKLAQQRLEEQKKREEEIKKLEEELRQKEEEERKKQEEEERRLKEIEDEKRRKKDEKIQKLKEEGKFQTKKEREKEIALQRRREELIAAGIISADQFASSTTTGDKPKSTAVRTKKPKQKKEENQNKASEENGKEDQNGGHEDNEPATEKKTEEADDWEGQAEEAKADEPKEVPADDLEDWEKFESVPEPKTEKTKPTKKSRENKTEKPVEEAKPVKTEEKAVPKQKTTEEKVKEPVQASTKPKTEANEEQKTQTVGKGESKANGPGSSVRSPIVCILGHVDTGKTKLLDKMRNTNVQEGEAGGITQQIGATFFPYEKIRDESAKVQGHYPFEVEVPGLLIIDTPGHESFSNLRSRGSGLCDIAILVVDIMHGLEKQTLESIELLRFRKTPFVIALNKIDRLYGWKSKPDISSHVSLKKQDKSVQLEFRDRSKAIMTELTEKGFNVALYYENPDPNSYVSIIPTSAHTGEGVPDLISVAVNLTQKRLRKKISKKDEFKCTVLEVKVIEGLGASIDVMLVDGTLKEGDQIALAGYDGPIVTNVRALLTPHPMKEMRVKNEYIHHKTISGAMGIKISANDLEKALAGSELYVVKNDDEVDECKKLLIDEIAKVKKSIKLVEEGVLVAASTLGSLEALLQFLKTSSIPVAAISIGPVSKAEVIKAMKPLQITEGEIKKEFATILAFDVKILNDAKDLAEQEGVKIFTANIIYHLFDHFTAYLNDIREEKKRNEGKLAVFPCVLKPVAFFNMKDPIVMGLDVLEGQLRIGTPICVAEKGKLRIGTVESMEKEHKPIQVVRPSDGSVAVKFKGDSTIMAGRHFELKDKLISIVSRESIDSLKKYFRDEMSKTDWELVKKLKPIFGVI